MLKHITVAVAALAACGLGACAGQLPSGNEERTYTQADVDAAVANARSGRGSPQSDTPPAPIQPAKCGFGMHIERFSTKAMSQQQFEELRDYLKNAKCGKLDQPGWLRQTDWSYGDTVPSKGSFTMNGVRITFYEESRPL